MKLTLRECVLSLALAMMVVLNAGWYIRTARTSDTAYAMYTCAATAEGYFRRGNTDLGLRWLTGATRAYFKGRCDVDSGVRIMLKPT